MEEKKIYRPSEVARLLGISKSTLYSWVEKNMFPPPIKLGLRAAGWTSEQINAWINSRINNRKEVKRHAKKNF